MAKNNAATATKPSAKANPVKTTPVSAIPHPNKRVVIHCADWEAEKKATGLDIYAPPLTVQDAKKLLGWESEPEYVAKMKSADPSVNEDAVKFGQDYFLVDLNGDKVRLHNNTRNRPWGQGISQGYMQDILKRHWELNGETVIIGRGGRVLSGQHRLIGLVFAEQARNSGDEATKAHWAEYWTTPVTLECTVMYGIDESSKVTRTIDNVKSRTLTDVIFADTDLFGGLKIENRKTVARYLDYAVKTLWNRTGEKKNSWEPKRTHSESLAFVDRHNHLKECVAFIYEEEKDGRLSKYLYPGTAAALLYLFACSSTPEEIAQDYHVQRPSDEKNLSFDNLKKAKMFFADLAREAPELQQVRMTRRPVRGDTSDSFSGIMFSEESDASFDEKVGIIVKAWNAYSKDESVEKLELMYEMFTPEGEDVSAFRQIEFPTVQGGIDIGDAPKKKAAKKVKDDETADTEGEEGDDTEGEEGAPAANPAANAYRAEWEADKREFTNHLVAYQSHSGNFIFAYDDAELAGGIVNRKPVAHQVTGAPRIVIGPNDMDGDAKMITDAGHNIIVIEKDKEGKRVRAYPYHQEVAEQTEQPTATDDDTPTPAATPTQPTQTVRRVVRKTGN